MHEEATITVGIAELGINFKMKTRYRAHCKIRDFKCFGKVTEASVFQPWEDKVVLDHCHSPV